MDRLYKSFSYLLVGLYLTACVSGQLPNLPQATKINFVIAHKHEIPKADIDSKITEEHEEKGAMGGGGTGALAALTCGPFYFICAMATIPIGMLTGTVVGNISGNLSSLPSEKTTRLLKNISESQKNIDFQAIIIEQLNTKSDVLYTISNEVDSITFIIKFTDVTFELEKRERIKLLLTAHVSLSKADQKRIKSKSSTQVFYYIS